MTHQIFNDAQYIFIRSLVHSFANSLLFVVILIVILVVSIVVRNDNRCKIRNQSQEKQYTKYNPGAIIRRNPTGHARRYSIGCSSSGVAWQSRVE